MSLPICAQCGIPGGLPAAFPGWICGGLMSPCPMQPVEEKLLLHWAWQARLREIEAEIAQERSQ